MKTPSPSRRILLLTLTYLMLLPLVSLSAQPADEQAQTNFERWFVLLIQGERAGYVHTVETTLPNGNIQTSSETKIKIARGPAVVAIAMSQTTTETSAGKPVESITSADLGQATLYSKYVFNEKDVTQITRQLGREVSKTFPLPDTDALAPAAAARFIEAQMQEGANNIKLKTIDTSLNLTTITLEMNRGEKTTAEVFGRTVPATLWRSTVSSIPGTTIHDYIDDTGRTLRTTLAMIPGMEMDMIAADKDLALSPLDTPQMLSLMLLKPAPGSAPVPTDKPTTSAVFEVTFKKRPENTGLNIDLPSTGSQRVIWGDDHTARIITNLNTPNSPTHDLPTEEHLAGSSMVQHADPAIHQLVIEALGENIIHKDTDQETSPPYLTTLSKPEQAERFRKFVNNFITEKNLSVGLATASEIAQTKEGDCTEHATLLAAMLRVQGIPSRTVSGLMYVPNFQNNKNIFGYHMWTQAFLPSTEGAYWVDLDPSMSEPAFDATHIALTISSLDDQSFTNDIVRLTPIMGRIQIKVIAVE
ncbi:transglutaminase-like domain-containing protein [Poriferisphaera sp. WC338]|uniref:transglutaminase-like domain-containing protein n=1 Tax=Poriferisphaera sp. WC338 TaxID=3425129 RepID=UPI003D8177D9